jgi:hypothetical protein
VLLGDPEEFVRDAKPVARDLARHTGYGVVIGTLLDGEVEVEECHSGLPTEAGGGIAEFSDDSRSVCDLAVTAVLASTHEPLARALLDAAAPPAADRRSFRRELAKIRQIGLAGRCDVALGLGCVCVAVLDDAGQLRGSIGLVCPASQWPPPMTALALLRGAARRLSGAPEGHRRPSA